MPKPQRSSPQFPLSEPGAQVNARRRSSRPVEPGEFWVLAASPRIGVPARWRRGHITSPIWEGVVPHTPGLSSGESRIPAFGVGVWRYASGGGDGWPGMFPEGDGETGYDGGFEVSRSKVRNWFIG